MTTVYVVRNQLGQYLTKKGEWCSGKDANQVFFKPNHDEALNQLIEANSKDIALRGTVEALEYIEKRLQIEAFGPEPPSPENPEVEPEAIADNP